MISCASVLSMRKKNDVNEDYYWAQLDKTEVRQRFLIIRLHANCNKNSTHRNVTKQKTTIAVNAGWQNWKQAQQFSLNMARTRRLVCDAILPSCEGNSFSRKQGYIFGKMRIEWISPSKFKRGIKPILLPHYSLKACRWLPDSCRWRLTHYREWLSHCSEV